jgi:hypothetical protein
LRAYLRAQVLRGLSIDDEAKYSLTPEGESAALGRLVNAVEKLEQGVSRP